MSKFVVSARKYRPVTFDEVVGQMHVAKTLKNALQTDKLAHAFLFCGPRGVGKTTCARILAKVINCENPKDKVEPCNECSSCSSFNDNASFNIIELDAASNNSVEHIRTLIEQVRFQPQHGTHKVFIIDEVHMLSSQAFNAFLKTLEEPPPYAIFILATTEKHKIIPTILSRCQIFDFKRIQVEDAVTQLQFICTQEDKKADPEALHLIAQKADGAMRDALSIFDKIASATGEHITYKDVISNLNILDYEFYFKVVDAFLREDLSDVLLIMDQVIRDGFEPEQFIQGLAEHMRDLLVCKDVRTIGLLDISDALKERYQHQAALASKSMLLTGLDILNQCDISLPRSKNKRLYTEIALSKINFSKRAIESNLTSGDSPEKKTKLVNENELSSNKTIHSEAPISQSITPKTKEVQIETPSNPSTTQNDDLKNTNQDENNTFQNSDLPTLKTTESRQNTDIETPNLEAVRNANAIDSFQKPSGIADIMASVKKEEAKLNEARKGLNQETLEKLWNGYTSAHNSPSTRAMLEIAKISLKGKTITILVPSNHYKNMVLEEEPLKELLREKLGTSDLMLDPIVDIDAFPDIEVEKPKALLSTKERYQYLAEKHPPLATLVKRLELKPDSGNQY
jgi:DNA polymerase-3 subunit gamma/tau